MTAFHAMGTEVTVLAPLLPQSQEDVLSDQVASLFEQTEQRYSRFRPSSTLSRINASDAPVELPDEMFALLERARGYSRLTGGMFDPTVGAAVRACGYDGSFAPGVLDRDASVSAPAHRAPGWGSLQLDASARTVTRAPDMCLDLGGLVKGYAVDLAMRLMPACAAVDAGGDAFLRGDGPDGGGWLVDVEHPADASVTLLTLRVRDAAVATSAPNRRNWRMGERRMHHLIDPRTGLPSESDLAQATIVAPSTELADVLAKAAFLLGSSGAERLLSSIAGVGGVLVGSGGGVKCVGRLEVASE